MDNKKEVAQSPAELLAARITATLTEKKLIHEGDAKKIQTGMLTGKIKSTDWRLAVEKTIEKENQDGK